MLNKKYIKKQYFLNKKLYICTRDKKQKTREKKPHIKEEKRENLPQKRREKRENNPKKREERENHHNQRILQKLSPNNGAFILFILHGATAFF